MSSEVVQGVLKAQRGVLFLTPALVYRGAYCGRDLLARNSQPHHADDRGYYPVERWIASTTQAANEKTREGEGLSLVLLGENETVPLVQVAEQVLGEYAQKWPLTKILDIGGSPVQPRFKGSSITKEVPPIPAHVHSGPVIGGRAVPPGKKEAYFFPPVDLPPYHADFGTVITRLGVRSDVTQEQFEQALESFGIDDSMYELLNVYPIQAYDGWTILPGVAPGPWLTFEIQYPQDDFNLCCWKLGCQISDPQERANLKQAFQMRGIDTHKNYIKELIKWDLTTESAFKDKYYRPSKVLNEGDWGRRIQIFFDGFYGEGFEINQSCSWTRPADRRPFAGVVWSGSGLLNGNVIEAGNEKCQEFLVVANTEVTIKGTSTEPVRLYVVFPFEY